MAQILVCQQLSVVAFIKSGNAYDPQIAFRPENLIDYLLCICFTEMKGKRLFLTDFLIHPQRQRLRAVGGTGNGNPQGRRDFHGFIPDVLQPLHLRHDIYRIGNKGLSLRREFHTVERAVKYTYMQFAFQALQGAAHIRLCTEQRMGRFCDGAFFINSQYIF